MKFKVKIGTPARNNSAVVEAADEKEAIKIAIDKIVDAGAADRELLESKVATGVWSRRNQGGLVYVERY